MRKADDESDYNNEVLNIINRYLRPFGLKGICTRVREQGISRLNKVIITITIQITQLRLFNHKSGLTMSNLNSLTSVLKDRFYFQEITYHFDRNGRKNLTFVN
jgi:hypothetical protein